MENGLGYPIFLPDNRLRLPGSTNTRGGRDERGRLSNSLSPNFKIYKRTNLHYVTTTTPHTAQNLHSIRHIFWKPHSSPVPWQTATPGDAPPTRRPDVVMSQWPRVNTDPETSTSMPHNFRRHIYGNVGTQKRSHSQRYCTGQRGTRPSANSSTSNQEDHKDEAPGTFWTAPPTVLPLQRRRVIIGIQILRRARKGLTST